MARRMGIEVPVQDENLPGVSEVSVALFDELSFEDYDRFWTAHEAWALIPEVLE